MVSHHAGRTAPLIGIGTLLAILALAAPTIALAANVTVTTIPGGGWIQAPENTLPARLVEGPGADIEGQGSVELSMAATSDFVGIGRAVVQPLSDLTGGSWRTYATGDSGTIASEPASLRFAMFRDGLADFTTMVVERVYNATVSPDVWQTTTLSDTTVVWQTNGTGGFCNVFPFCTFAQFKAQYPDANITGLQVAIGTSIPVTTSYLDGVSLTIDGTTDHWDFEIPAADASTAVIGAAVPTDTGADVTIDLSASALAVEPVVFTIQVEGQPPQTVTLDPGESTTITVSVPFGSTDIAVQAAGGVLASATVTVTAPAPSVPGSVVVVTPPPTDTVAPATSSGTAGGEGLLLLFGAVILFAWLSLPKRRSGPARQRD
jgi:hypothetical protein